MQIQFMSVQRVIFMHISSLYEARCYKSMFCPPNLNKKSPTYNKLFSSLQICQTLFALPDSVASTKCFRYYFIRCIEG